MQLLDKAARSNNEHGVATNKTKSIKQTTEQFCEKQKQKIRKTKTSDATKIETPTLV